MEKSEKKELDNYKSVIEEYLKAVTDKKYNIEPCVIDCEPCLLISFDNKYEIEVSGVLSRGKQMYLYCWTKKGMIRSFGIKIKREDLIESIITIINCKHKERLLGRGFVDIQEVYNEPCRSQRFC